ncbi:flavoprotein [Tissierella sp.]|uniref:flavoprotein n=1 Tax=Tissierella sp. TaxID=41274 RepID=UPI0028609F92|nr:flavoprotein [Tissierella sp.]MDR7855627.1 flavoprotein [Tissierella sp.]
MKTKITENILQDISNRLKGESPSSKGEKALVVLTGSTIGLDKRIKHIKELKNKGLQISLAFSFMAEQLIDTKEIINLLSPVNVYRESDIFRLKDITKDYSSIIAPNITMNTLSKVTLGMIDSCIPTLIWTFLYGGKKVVIDFSSVRYYLGEETNNKEISNILENHISTIKKMGAREIKEDNYLENFSIMLESNKIDLNKTNRINENKKVITERDILNLTQNQNLNLLNGTIITPLAKDRAREMNIQINFNKGG